MIIDISTIIPAVAFILYVFFAVFGFSQYRKDRFYWSFQFYMVLFSVWSFGSMMMHLGSAFLTPLFWNRFMLVGLLAAPFALGTFIMDILEIHDRRVKKTVYASYILVLPLFYLNLSGQIVVDAGFTEHAEFFYQLGSGAVVAYGIIYLYLIFMLAIMLVGSKKRSSKTPQRNLLLPLIGVAIMLVGILMNINPELGKYPIDIFSATINAGLLFYTIYKYKLINYSRMGLSVIFGTILAVIASISYFVIMEIVQHFNESFAPENVFQLSLILGVVTVIVIQPIRNLFIYVVDSVIIPKRHPYQATIKKLSKKLTTIVNLKNLGEEVVTNLKSGIKANWVLFAAKQTHGGERYLLIAHDDCPTSLSVGDELVQTFDARVNERLDRLRKENTSSILYAKPDEEKFSISRKIPPADVLIPVIFRQQVAGYIFIGLDEMKTFLRPNDLEALEILAAQTALSLENALSFEQLRLQGDELTMSKNKLEAIFNGIASPVCLIDIDYSILEANTAAVKLFGDKKNELIGGKCYRAFFQRSKPCSFCQALECLHSGVMQETESAVADRYYSFQFHTVRVPENSKSVFIEIIKDVTEQKNLQEELIRTEKMAGLGTLATGIAHELNNPLAGISGTAEVLLADASPDDPNRELMEDILSYARTASDVIKELAIYSRKDVVKEMQQVEIIQVLEFSLRLAMRGVDSSDIIVKRNYHALPVIPAHEANLQQLFLNLIVNAIQAMDGNGILTLTCFEKDGFVHVRIGDSGCGISEDHLSQIFTPFFTTKAPGSGTGLGLSNCYGIVEKMRGRIRVRSELGAGSEFTTILPVNNEERDAIRFHLVEDQSGLNDVFFLQRKVLVGEKGYMEDSIHRSDGEKAVHILAFRGLQPVGTVSLMTSEEFHPLPLSRYFDIDSVLQSKKSAEILRLAVLPEVRHTSVSIGLIVLIFLLARSKGVEEIVIDSFADDTRTIKLYKKFGFREVGTYYSPSAVTVLALQQKTTMEQDQSQLRHFVRPLFERLRPMFDFGNQTQAILTEMDAILSAESQVQKEQEN